MALYQRGVERNALKRDQGDMLDSQPQETARM